jgi:hypothetical protein
MEPITPFWFKQRQAKLESAGDNVYKVTAPNQADAYILIRAEDDRWLAAVRSTADGADLMRTPAEFTSPGDAWEAAFELYRQVFVV